MKIIVNSARCAQQKATNVNKRNQSRIIVPIITKHKNNTYHHEYEHDDIYIETNIKHEQNRIVIKHSYYWVDANNKENTKTDLHVFKK